MGTAWWKSLGKDNRGSRPRCVLLTDGSSQEVATRITDLVGLPDVTVSASDLWLPMGKPFRTNKGWPVDLTGNAFGRAGPDGGAVYAAVGGDP